MQYDGVVESSPTLYNCLVFSVVYHDTGRWGGQVYNSIQVGSIVVPEHRQHTASFHFLKSVAVGSSHGNTYQEESFNWSETANLSSVVPSHLDMSDRCRMLQNQRTMSREKRSFPQ